MSISEIIKKTIKKALKEIGVEEIEISLEHPVNLSHGDYSTNVALSLSKKLKKNPKEFAEEILKIINKEKIEEIEKVEIAGAGFINFSLSKQFIANKIASIIHGENFLPKNTNVKVIVEYTDPNPFKEFHIGHLMTNAVGEAIARVLSASGMEVKRACYQGDVGLHVAKAVWSILKSVQTDNRGGATLIYSPTAAFAFGKAYAEGNEAYEKNKKAKEEIIEINKKIYNINHNSKDFYGTFSVEEIYKKGRKISLEYFESIYRKLGTAFDYYFFESETGLFGKKVVEENIGNIFEKSDNAVIFKGEKYGLHTRVFINSEGLPTYEAKELGLAKIKYEKYHYDKSIVVTGNEINEYFKVLLSAMMCIFPDLASKTQHVGHGMLRLPSGKMSSRTGDVITGEFLIQKVKESVLEKIQGRDFPYEQKNNIAEKVAIGAIKFSILRSAIGSNIIFDFEKSISFEGDSGPYLQYSYARAMSVLNKVELKIEDGEFIIKNLGELERLLCRFPEIVMRAKEELQPHYIADYLIRLAAAFNSFYAKNSILEAGEESPWRIALTKAFASTLSEGLNILAIPVLEKM